MTSTPLTSNTTRSTSATLHEAAYFLMQAGFGGSMDEIQAVATQGFAAWITDQKTQPQSKTFPYMDSLRTIIDSYGGTDAYTDAEQDQIEDSYAWRFTFRNRAVPHAENFRTAWMRNVVHGPDVLRQRMAWALSEILVASFEDNKLNRGGIAIADYYDTLSTHALGNYRDLLYDVSVHPVMAFWLTSLGNSKASDDGTIQPDENYAREIMQLFSIGLWDLNNNGTQKLDGQGNPIPAYSNDEIENLARVFTGMDYATQLDSRFGRFKHEYDVLGMNFEDNYMRMFDDHHDTGEKNLFVGKPWAATIPANQSGFQDISDAVDILFNHPNTPAFVCFRLIQNMVTSNPSNGYVRRVSDVFRDNGSGVRGDLFAVAQAILLDQEARTIYNGGQAHGKMIPPLLRFTRLIKAFGVGADSTDWVLDPRYAINWRILQWPMESPTVFNFYEPGFKPGGPLIRNNDPNQRLYGPEFQLMDSVRIVEFLNGISYMIDLEVTQPHDASSTPGLYFDFTVEETLLEDLDALLDRLSTLLTCGQLTDDTKLAVKQMLEQYTPNMTNDGQRTRRLRALVWIIAACPEASTL